MDRLNTIITLSRQYASNGKEIGEKVAKILDIPYYDKEILNLAAKESGICKELFIQNDEKPTNSFLFGMVTGMRGMAELNSVYMDMPLNHKLFLAQFDTIKRIASQGPCVIIGRCGDYVLHDNPNALKVFVYGDLETRIDSFMKDHDLDYKQAKDIVNKKDRQRASYYSYFAGEDWGDKENYDLCINSSKISTDFAASIIVEYAKVWNKQL